MIYSEKKRALSKAYNTTLNEPLEKVKCFETVQKVNVHLKRSDWNISSSKEFGSLDSKYRWLAQQIVMLSRFTSDRTQDARPNRCQPIILRGAIEMFASRGHSRNSLRGFFARDHLINLD